MILFLVMEVFFKTTGFLTTGDLVVLLMIRCLGARGAPITGTVYPTLPGLVIIPPVVRDFPLPRDKHVTWFWGDVEVRDREHSSAAKATSTGHFSVPLNRYVRANTAC